MTIRNNSNYFVLTDLLQLNIPGIKMHQEHFTIATNIKELENRIVRFTDKNISNKDLMTMYSLSEVTDWRIEQMRQLAGDHLNPRDAIFKIDYRPFDYRFCLVDNFIDNNAWETLKLHAQSKINLFLNISAKIKNTKWTHFFITRNPSYASFFGLNDDISIFPLYLFPREEQGNLKRIPNLNQKTIREIAISLSLTFIPEKEPEGNVCMAGNREVRPEFKLTFTPADTLDYIYAVLHSPAFHEKDTDFFESGTPKIPFPTDPEQFWQLVGIGDQLRKTHMLESPEVYENFNRYPLSGKNNETSEPTLKKIHWENSDPSNDTGRIWINDMHFFENIPLQVWKYNIGGYQPAIQWLIERSGHTLTRNEIVHYQKIIVALNNTCRLKQKLDGIKIG